MQKTYEKITVTCNGIVHVGAAGEIPGIDFEENAYQSVIDNYNDILAACKDPDGLRYIYSVMTAQAADRKPSLIETRPLGFLFTTGGKVIATYSRENIAGKELLVSSMYLARVSPAENTAGIELKPITLQFVICPGTVITTYGPFMTRQRAITDPEPLMEAIEVYNKLSVFPTSQICAFIKLPTIEALVS